jgi:hypothetical protein
MTNPTSNFGWQMPTSTDLVTDLPADFETFGQAVDTSLAELKGGTSGQVLSKASNTDMDFTWVTSDDANAIQNTIVDAKGDLIAASASDVPARLAVGNNGETLVADSSASTGLAWGVMRGSNRNYCYNSGFDIWQRGTTFAITAVSNTYTADRWQITLNQRTSGTLTINQNTSQKQTADNYCMEVDASALVTTSTINVTQILETLDVVPLRGKIVTASVWMKVASGTATVGQLLQDGTDTNAFPSTGTTADSLNASVTTTWTRFSVTHTVASGANSIAWRLSTPSAFAGKLYISEVQFEVSPTGASNQPTTWVRQNATIQGELAACQRYYWRNTVTPSVAAVSTTGYVENSTTANVAISMPSEMRTIPTSVEYSSLRAYDASVINAVSAVVLKDSTPKIVNVGFTSSGMTAGRAVVILAAASGTPYLGISAEL